MTRCRAARTAPQAVPDAVVALVRLLARQAAREVLDGCAPLPLTDETGHDRQD